MILGKRVRLRAMERNDLRQFQEWLNDPEVAEGLSLYLPASAADEEKWLVGVMICVRHGPGMGATSMFTS